MRPLLGGMAATFDPATNGAPEALMARTTYAPRGALKAKADPMSQPDLKSRCTATSKAKGTRCGRAPIPGGTVCRYHGGAAPQVRMAALARLTAYQDRAIDRLFGLVEQEDYPSTAMSAVNSVLDRTMGRAKESLDMHVTGEVALVPERLAAARKRLAQKPNESGGVPPDGH